MSENKEQSTRSPQADYRSTLTRPYVTTTNYTRVKLLPSELNNDLYVNLKNRLIERVEGKCTKYNYICKVFDLTIDSHGEIELEDEYCGAVFNVTYTALVCNLVRGMLVVATVAKTNPKMLVTTNRGFIGITLMDTLNKDKFFFDNRRGKLMERQKDEPVEVAPGDHLVVQIGDINYFANQTEIQTIISVVRRATPEEAAEFVYRDSKPSVSTQVEFDEH